MGAPSRVVPVAMNPTEDPYDPAVVTARGRYARLGQRQPDHTGEPGDQSR